MEKTEYYKYYTYTVYFSTVDELWIASTMEMPDITGSGKTAEKAINEAQFACKAVIEHFIEEKNPDRIPFPFKLEKDTQSLSVNLPKWLFNRLARQASKEKISVAGHAAWQLQDYLQKPDIY